MFFFKILFVYFLFAFLNFKNVSKTDPIPLLDFKKEFVEPWNPITRWCEEADSEFKKLKWNIQPCKKIPWKIENYSILGRPIVYAEFGNVHAENTTLIFSTVHGDEITPFYLAIELANHLQSKVDVGLIELKKTRVVVAPLVNPDGFYRKPRTRVNARGVDINRNFSTKDWNKALTQWKQKYRSDPRRYPGLSSSSEPETIFQNKLIEIIKPQKILSIHSPLNFLDYVGPGVMNLEEFPKDYAHQCEKLRQQLNAMKGDSYPGSLGNYGGRDLGIPTLTLELPSADASKAKIYWQKYQNAIETMVYYVVPNFEKKIK